MKIGRNRSIRWKGEGIREENEEIGKKGKARNGKKERKGRNE